MPKKESKERNLDMYRAILEIKDLEECCHFFEDICAMQELQSMEQRFEVAKMLRKEKVYLEIIQETKASSATISRVKRMLNYGTGCLGAILDRLDEKGSLTSTEKQ